MSLLVIRIDTIHLYIYKRFYKLILFTYTLTRDSPSDTSRRSNFKYKCHYADQELIYSLILTIDTSRLSNSNYTEKTIAIEFTYRNRGCGTKLRSYALVTPVAIGTNSTRPIYYNIAKKPITISRRIYFIYIYTTLELHS